MRTKRISASVYDVNDLANPHFRNAEIITLTGEKIKGQFVKFKVPEGLRGYKLYPSEKLCFLPEENKKQFWHQHALKDGIFEELPAYIRELGLDEIAKIMIVPALVL